MRKWFSMFHQPKSKTIRIWRSIILFVENLEACLFRFMFSKQKRFNNRSYSYGDMIKLFQALSWIVHSNFQQSLIRVTSQFIDVFYNNFRSYFPFSHGVKNKKIKSLISDIVKLTIACQQRSSWNDISSLFSSNLQKMIHSQSYSNFGKLNSFDVLINHSDWNLKYA